MLVVRNNTRIADIYLGEFMRLYTHHAFRETVKRYLAQHGEAGMWQPNYLKESDQWQTDYFDPATERYMRRLYFANGRTV
jgi:hypothetical protein